MDVIVAAEAVGGTCLLEPIDCAFPNDGLQLRRCRRIAKPVELPLATLDQHVRQLTVGTGHCLGYRFSCRLDGRIQMAEGDGILTACRQGCVCQRHVSFREQVPVLRSF